MLPIISFKLDKIMSQSGWYEPTKFYNNKESFGDLDIVLNKKYLKENWAEILIGEFELIKGNYSKNSDVLSLCYDELQIDLIMAKDNEYETSLVYYSYQDMNNLIRRLAKKLSVKYGHKGLELVVKNADNVLGNLLLTTDTKTIHGFLDLNHFEYLIGFNELENMFRWISNSKYFNKDIYLLHNRNATSRVRDKKRATYNAFLKWCEENEMVNNYPYKDTTEFDGYNIREPFFTYLVCTTFSEAKPFYDKVMENYQLNLKFKKLYNGEVVSNITGLSGKELGHFMSYTKEALDRCYGKEFIVNTFTDREIKIIIEKMKHYYDENLQYPITNMEKLNETAI